MKANFGWREYWVYNGADIVTKVNPKIAPVQYFLGILGTTGFVLILEHFCCWYHCTAFSSPLSLASQSNTTTDDNEESQEKHYEK